MIRNAGKITLFMIAAVAAVAFALPTVISAGKGQNTISITLIILIALIASLILAIRRI